MKYLKIGALVIAAFFVVENSAAQLPTDADVGDSISSILPFAAYTSDFGLFGGVLYQRINYRDGYQPFYSNLKAEINASTRGRWVAELDYERLTLFGRPIRNYTFLELFRDPQSTYYGVGNETTYTSEEQRDGVFYLLTNRAELAFDMRRKLYQFSDNGYIDGVVRLKTSYTSTEDRGADTRFVLNPPPGVDGGWVNKLGVGSIMDSRDSEFSPNKGVRAEAGINVSESVLGSSYSFVDGFVDLRGFIPLGWDIVLAQRAELQVTHGEVPFYEMATIGNERGLRGYALDRFIGDRSILYMAEVRKWLFSILDDEIRFGGHVFLDMGRVFTDEDTPRFFDDWKRTKGFGGTISAFSPDLIMRGEVGFSDEDLRIYVGVGYAF